MKMNDEKNNTDDNSLDSEKKEPVEVIDQIKKELNKKILINFLIVASIFVAIFAIFTSINNEKKEDEIPKTLRKVHEFNEKVSKVIFDPNKMAPLFPKEKGEDMKPNGDIGMNEDFDISSWELNAFDQKNNKKAFSIDKIKAMPSIEMTTEFKCVEGWSKIVNWKGVKLKDFLEKNNLIEKDSNYIYLETPDKKYYVGLDIETAKHEQTLLAYEMNGKPLTLEHGAPLRLVSPLKYGIKQIKRIGNIKVMTERPKDYWAEQGYDWYAGH